MLPETSHHLSEVTDKPLSNGTGPVRLERQAEHKPQGEVAVNDLVKKVRSDRAIKWRPLDLRELIPSTEIDLSHANITSLDGSARIFQPVPLPILARAAALADFSNFDRLLPQQDPLDVDHKTMTSGTRSSTSSDHATTTWGEAPNKEELDAVFGHCLRPPTFCQSYPGTKNGQVQFCSHPNGDVSAQQWFENQYQWINVGQYSNVRKRTEGQLASDRLRGETGLQALQKNTLAYFRVIAKQREAAVMNTVLDTAEVQACFKSVPQRHDVSTDVPIGSASHGSVAVPTGQIWSPAPTCSTRVVPQVRMPPHHTPSTRYTNLCFGAISQDACPHSGVGISEQSQYSPQYMYHTSSLATTSHVQGAAPGFAYMKSVYGGTIRNARHEHMTDPSGLTAIMSASEARPTADNSTGRTVMYDPLQDAERSTMTGLPETEGAYNSHGTDVSRAGPLGTSTSFFLQRHRDTIQRLGIKTASDLREPPTPQLLDQSSLRPFNERIRSTYEQELHEWFTSSAKAERHESLHRLLVAQSLDTTDKHTSGTIAKPTSVLLDCGILDPQDDGITRLLIPICENLDGYVEGNLAQHHSHWAPFVPPPEWAIDRSAIGNNSFLDDG